MQQVSFDSLTWAKNLEDAGMPRPQAEVIARLQLQSSADLFERLATKVELAQLDVNLRKEIKESEMRLELKIETIKADLFKWIIPLMLGQAGIIVALLKLI